MEGQCEALVEIIVVVAQGMNCYWEIYFLKFDSAAVVTKVFGK